MSCFDLLSANDSECIIEWGEAFVPFIAYPHFGQPEAKSSFVPVAPHFGHLTEIKNFPHFLHIRAFSGTSEPQFSQKNLVFLFAFIFFLNQTEKRTKMLF